RSLAPAAHSRRQTPPCRQTAAIRQYAWWWSLVVGPIGMMIDECKMMRRNRAELFSSFINHHFSSSSETHRILWPSRYQVAADFPDAAGAHGDDQIAFLGFGTEIVADLLKVRQMNGARSARVDLRDQIRAADGGLVFFAVTNRINVRDNRLIGIGEAGGKFFQQKPRAAVLVRLKDAQQPARLVARPQRRQRRADLGGMMAVIIDDDRAIESPRFGHPAIDALELPQSLGGGAGADPA